MHEFLSQLLVLSVPSQVQRPLVDFDFPSFFAAICVFETFSAS